MMALVKKGLKPTDLNCINKQVPPAFFWRCTLMKRAASKRCGKNGRIFSFPVIKKA